jgi:glycosyltransferase involved in cell wall biosynthesis
MNPTLSICIPTFNREIFLESCLSAIEKSLQNFSDEIEICISDNCSTDRTNDVVKKYSERFNISYSINFKNIWGSANLVKVISMAKGNYVWVIGDDDLLLPDSIKNIITLLHKTRLDFYFINAYSLSTEEFFDQDNKFNFEKIPESTKVFSKLKNSFECNFYDLINPKISFDFLGALYLSIFKRELWVSHVHLLNIEELIEKDRFEIFETTFPQIKVFAQAFSSSRAFFLHKPMLISLSGAQDWISYWPLIKSVRMVESLKHYRNGGMGLISYLRNMNYAHNTFASDFIKMALDQNSTGAKYVNLKRTFLNAMLFPAFYLSIFRGIKNLIQKIV